MKTKYCLHCDKEVKSNPITKTETYNIKGQEVTILATVYICPQCGEELWDDEIDNENLIKILKGAKK